LAGCGRTRWRRRTTRPELGDLIVRAVRAGLFGEALASFGLWSELLMLGGYRPDGASPAESGAIPDIPFLLAEVTIERQAVSTGRLRRCERRPAQCRHLEPCYS
jgi:hypothetical protein